MFFEFLGGVSVVVRHFLGREGRLDRGQEERREGGREERRRGDGYRTKGRLLGRETSRTFWEGREVETPFLSWVEFLSPSASDSLNPL